MVILNDWSYELTKGTPMHETLSVSEFKARCLELFERLSKRRLDKITVTRRGKPVAVVTSPQTPESEAKAVAGSMAGMVIMPPGFDLTAPILDEPLDAARGKLHQ
jgi:antitoxin (DNA-binding transcriptional repressor) of toxin-antitoxin stability system